MRYNGDSVLRTLNEVEKLLRDKAIEEERARGRRGAEREPPEPDAVDQEPPARQPLEQGVPEQGFDIARARRRLLAARQALKRAAAEQEGLEPAPAEQERPEPAPAQQERPEPGSPGEETPARAATAETASDPIGDPSAAHEAVKRMIMQRDKEAMAALKDPEKAYELAADIDDFVDEILRKSRGPR